MNALQSLKTQYRLIPKVVEQAWHERDLGPLPLESELLLKCISDGGHKGQFLADAFLSTYRGDTFYHSLKDLTKLDAEAFRLFLEILHIHPIKRWSDDSLYTVEKQIKETLASEY